MPNSYIHYPASTGANINLEFGSDYTYSLGRTKVKATEMGLPNGNGAFVAGDHSYAMLRAVEGIVSIPAGSSADKILWTVLDELVRLYTNSKKISRIRLYLDDAGGYVECDGWMTSYNAARDSKDGHAVIKVTFDFLIQTKDTTNIN